jgi:hypothetical protein
MPLSAEQLAAIDAELTNGNLIAAIRAYRGFTGSGLATAKRFIDARDAELRDTAPAAFLQPISPVQPDPAVMSTIIPVADRELQSLRRVLKQIEKLLYGFNYQVTLSANAASLPPGSIPVIETMVTLYPDSEPGNAETTAASIADFKSDVADCLTYEGDSSSGPQLSTRNRSRLNDQLIPDLWLEIAAITPFEGCSILSNNNDTGLPGYYVYWFFAYLIHCPANRRCLVLTGMSSD